MAPVSAGCPRRGPSRQPPRLPALGVACRVRRGAPNALVDGRIQSVMTTPGNSNVLNVELMVGIREPSRVPEDDHDEQAARSFRLTIMYTLAVLGGLAFVGMIALFILIASTGD